MTDSGAQWLGFTTGLEMWWDYFIHPNKLQGETYEAAGVPKITGILVRIMVWCLVGFWIYKKVKKWL
jgi:hypothetical protein